MPNKSGEVKCKKLDNGKLQFDYARCCEDRGHMGTLFPEWSCARCVSTCATDGNRRHYAAKNYYNKMRALTRNA